MNRGRDKGEGWSTANLLKLPSNFIAGRPNAALLFYSMVILDVVCFFLWFFSLYINIKIVVKC